MNTQSTPLPPFLSDVFMWWMKHDIEDEINQTIDDDFFVNSYNECVERWRCFYTIENAHSFYQEASEEIKSDWFGRNSKSTVDQAKELFDEMDDEERTEFLRLISVRESL